METYEEGWMLSVPEQMEMNETLNYLKYLFFQQMIRHKYKIGHLLWLQRWIGDLEMNHYQNETLVNTKERHRMEFLTKIWFKEYFNPFITPEDAHNIVKNYKTGYVVALSSTVPGTIRITYWRDGVKHHRIQVEEYITKNKIERIDYDIYKLEMIIQNHIQKHSSNSSCISTLYVNNPKIEKEVYK